MDRKTLRHHFGIDRAAALLNHGNAEANPVELAAGYLRHAIKAGARFHAPHDVADIACNRRGTTLLTDDGIEIQARQVVFCTGYELAKIVPATNNKILSTWAIATRPQPNAIWPQKALIWEASEPDLYLRATQDGRIICGGEDEDLADTEKRDALTHRKAQRIEQKLQRLFPDIDSRAVVSWTGTFGGSANGMPTIGAIPGISQVLRGDGLWRQRHYLFHAATNSSRRRFWAGRRRRRRCSRSGNAIVRTNRGCSVS